MGLDLTALRGVAHELADLADALTLPAFQQHLEVEYKADRSPVTAVDREVERTLRAQLRSRFPDHAVLGEEDGLDGPADAPTWVIDPIDATKNFIRGNPVFATLIALRIDGQEVVGVVSAPALSTRWDGIADGPARRDGQPVTVSATPRLADATISLGGLGYFVDKGYGDLLTRVARSTDRQRGFGDFWQHVLVADGTIDVAMEAEVSLWDLAAVKCVVEAAGGRFTSLDGEATADGGSAVSSNGRLHDEALTLVRG